MSRHLIVSALVALMLIGCDTFGTTDIGEIVRNPAKYEGETVKVRGEVTQVTKIPLLELKSYTLRDGTGEIVVQTDGALPALHEKTTIRAQVKAVAIIDGKSLGLRLIQIE